MMLTGCRPGEAMRPTWAEFAETGLWDKPSAHTKQRRRHRVPLSPAATEFIEQIRAKKTEGVDFGFPVKKRNGAKADQDRMGRRHRPSLGRVMGAVERREVR